MRIILGVVFVFHGSQKLFGLFDGPGLATFTAYLHQLELPYPQYLAVLAAGTEFLGGLALILGLQMRTMMVPLATTMFVAAFVVHRGQFDMQHGGMEYPLTLGMVTTGLAMTGPGRFSLSTLIKIKNIILPDEDAIALERRLGA